MRSSKVDLPKTMEMEGSVLRSVEWGDMEVAYNTVAKDFDVISNRKFNFYLKRQLEEKTQKLFLQKDLPPVNPEVYAKGLNLLKKLRKTFTEQVREVEKAMLSVEESLSKNENKNKRNIENKEET